MIIAIEASLQEVDKANDPQSEPPTPNHAIHKARAKKSARNPAPSPTLEVFDSCVSPIGDRIVPGDTVELRYGEGDRSRNRLTELPPGDFLRVYEIHSSNGKISLKGILFRRARYMKGMFTRQVNELCMVLGAHPSAEKGLLENSMVLKPLDAVIKKRKLCLTNEHFPSHSYRTRSQCIGVATRDIFDEHDLVCRWAYIGKDYPDAYWLDQRILLRLTLAICKTILRPQDRFVSMRELRQAAAGSSLENAINLEAETNCPASLDRSYNLVHLDPARPGQYTFCDAFAGPGGASQSAKMAGLHVVLAVDKDPLCIVTYEKNHPNAEVYAESIEEFIRRFAGRWPRIDVLHISPPCQPFSPSKTRRTAQDEENEATLCSVEPLIKAIKPRVVTLEQTFGISLQGQHQVFFRGLLGMFTTNGYNMRSQTIQLADYDCFQSRKRLIVFATR